MSIVKAGLLACVLLFPVTAQANIIILDVAHLAKGTAPSGSAPWLTLQFADDLLNPGVVRFTLTSHLQSGSEFFRRVAFNTVVRPAAIDFSLVSTFGSFDVPSIKQRANAINVSSVHDFDIGLRFKTSNKDGGIHRFDGLDQIVWDLSCASCSAFTANSFNATRTDRNPRSDEYAAARVLGIPASGRKGGTIVANALTTVPPPSNIETVVPEPATLLLLGAGLAVGARRWRRR
jgi:hypothetical protein